MNELNNGSLSASDTATSCVYTVCVCVCWAWLVSSLLCLHHNTVILGQRRSLLYFRPIIPVRTHTPCRVRACVCVCVHVSCSVLIPLACYTLIHSQSRQDRSASPPRFPVLHTLLSWLGHPKWTQWIYLTPACCGLSGAPMSAGMVVGAAGQVSVMVDRDTKLDRY